MTLEFWKVPVQTGTKPSRIITRMDIGWTLFPKKMFGLTKDSLLPTKRTRESPRRKHEKIK